MNLEIECKHCGRYLFTAMSTTILEQMVCSNSKCKAKLNFKIVNHLSSNEQIAYKFATKETQPKEIKK